MYMNKWNETGKQLNLPDGRSHRHELLGVSAETQYLQFFSQIFALLRVYLASAVETITWSVPSRVAQWNIWNKIQHINLHPLWHVKHVKPFTFLRLPLLVAGGSSPRGLALQDLRDPEDLLLWICSTLLQDLLHGLRISQRSAGAVHVCPSSALVAPAFFDL